MFAGSRVFSTTSTAQNPPLFVDFNCGSNANDLSDCSNLSGLTTSIYSCTSNVVGVQCARKYSTWLYWSVHKIQILYCNTPALCEERDIRLAGGDSYGRVEVCSNGLWGTICSDEFWDDHNAGVLCKQLGFSQYGKISSILAIHDHQCSIFRQICSFFLSRPCAGVSYYACLEERALPLIATVDSSEASSSCMFWEALNLD